MARKIPTINPSAETVNSPKITYLAWRGCLRSMSFTSCKMVSLNDQVGRVDLARPHNIGVNRYGLYNRTVEICALTATDSARNGTKKSNSNLIELGTPGSKFHGCSIGKANRHRPISNVAPHAGVHRIRFLTLFVTKNHCPGRQPAGRPAPTPPNSLLTGTKAISLQPSSIESTAEVHLLIPPWGTCR